MCEDATEGVDGVLFCHLLASLRGRGLAAVLEVQVGRLALGPVASSLRTCHISPADDLCPASSHCRFPLGLPHPHNARPVLIPFSDVEVSKVFNYFFGKRVWVRHLYHIHAATPLFNFHHSFRAAHGTRTLSNSGMCPYCAAGKDAPRAVCSPGYEDLNNWERSEMAAVIRGLVN